MRATLDIFLADPLVTSIPLPVFDHKRVRFAYRLEMDSTTSKLDDELLEEAYRLLNVNHPRDYRQRSLSAGDVVTIAEARSYVCDWTGWKELDATVNRGDRVALLQMVTTAL